MGYSPWITLKKMVYQGGIVFLSGGVAAVISWVPTVETTSETQALIFGIALILLKGAENFLKHMSD